MASRDGESLVKKNRPDDTRFKQQRLHAWKPVITAKSTLPYFLLLGAVFMIVGGILYAFTQQGREKELDYTKCNSTTPGLENSTCADFRMNRSRMWELCECKVPFHLSEDWTGEVLLYYKLTNFYQNHRRYIRSRNDQQLRGSLSSTGECAPIRTGKDGLPVAPCGLIANSFFNDTFELNTQSGQNVTLFAKGIAWSSDKNTKFKNPTVALGSNLSEAFKDTVPPPNWQKPVYDLSSDNSNNGFENEDFIVWMRTAALPTFRKLHRRIPGGLKKGDYVITVNYTYPVDAFDGRKVLVLSTISWLGGKNSFLGIAYLTVGSICFTASAVLLTLHKYRTNNLSFTPSY